MRIPTSTIVMGLVTCVPFALAIHAGTGNRHHDEPEEEDAEMVLAREAQMRADEAAQQRRAAESRAEEIHRLYGTEPATPGLLFGGIHLGTPEVTPTQERNVHTFEGGSIALQTDDTGLYQISITLHADCDVLERKLADSWGPSQRTENGVVWLNPATHTRALFHSSPECELFYDQYATADEWINKDDASIVPLWALGQPAEKLTDALTLPPSAAKRAQLTWIARGIGTSGERTHLTAKFENGKVAGLTASSAATSSISTQVYDQLVALYGEPKDCDGTCWPAGKFRISLAGSEHVFTVTIAKK
jgi:hypothetical protein